MVKNKNIYKSIKKNSSFSRNEIHFYDKKEDKASKKNTFLSVL